MRTVASHTASVGNSEWKVKEKKSSSGSELVNTEACERAAGGAAVKSHWALSRAPAPQVEWLVGAARITTAGRGGGLRAPPRSKVTHCQTDSSQLTGVSVASSVLSFLERVHYKHTMLSIGTW